MTRFDFEVLRLFMANKVQEIFSTPQRWQKRSLTKETIRRKADCKKTKIIGRPSVPFLWRNHVTVISSIFLFLAIRAYLALMLEPTNKDMCANKKEPKGRTVRGDQQILAPLWHQQQHAKVNLSSLRYISLLVSLPWQQRNLRHRRDIFFISK